MSSIIRFLSADVPGGIYLLLFVLVVINLTFYFFRNSDLISRERLKKNAITANVVILLLYIALWFVYQPPKPQERVVVLPSKTGATFKVKPGAFRFAEVVKKVSINNTPARYLFHRWHWLYETLTPKKVGDYRNWLSAARAMNARYLIESSLGKDGFTCIVKDLKKNKNYRFDQNDTLSFSGVLHAIQKKFHFFRKEPAPPKAPDNEIMKAFLSYLNGDYDKVLKSLDQRSDFDARVLIAAAYVRKGLDRPVDFEKMKYIKIKNPDFVKARQLLIPIVKERKDTPDVDILLGRMAIREQQFGKAEIFLKKAYVDDPENARVYFYLSFLLPDRLKDIGYKDRVAVLERAVYFDPGYRDAVYQLANEIYLAGTGTLRSTSEGIRVAERFLKIQPGDAEIRSLLGSLYAKTNHPEKALPIFKQLQEEYPNDPNSYYSLGICYYLMKNDSAALQNFMKAIHMSHHRDSYLYVAMIYNRQGKLDSALKYFRQRVKLKTGDDDQYALEAMYGIRTILKKIEEQNKKHEVAPDSSDNSK